METVVDRFIRYAKMNTQSDENSGTVPSTACQRDLAEVLVKEMKEIGLSEVSLDENGYVMATLEANTTDKQPVIGLISHLDTSPDFSAENVHPVVHQNYNGGNIILDQENDIILSPSDFPELLEYKGNDLITTDGHSLLGADDKAGVAEILTAMEYLVQHPEIKHGRIRIGFTPDEEIGRGADHFDVKKFNADYAYTLDGGRIGELEYENFNAALATITIKGRNVHPGTAKGQMVNSMHLAMEFNALLPAEDRPEFTTGYEGFFHLIDITGTVEQTTLRYLVRDFDRRNFEHRKELLQQAAETLRKSSEKSTLELEIKDQYFNMHEKIEPVMHIVDRAKKAMEACGVKPLIQPIRGGTDGSRLSFMDLPTPNLFAGGHNFHGRFEFIPVQSMEKAVEVIVQLVKVQ